MQSDFRPQLKTIIWKWVRAGTNERKDAKLFTRRISISKKAGRLWSTRTSTCPRWKDAQIPVNTCRQPNCRASWNHWKAVWKLNLEVESSNSRFKRCFMLCWSGYLQAICFRATSPLYSHYMKELPLKGRESHMFSKEEKRTQKSEKCLAFQNIVLHRQYSHCALNTHLST